jgi:hypothetical protein
MGDFLYRRVLADGTKARLTILIDPAQKQAFESLCAAHDLTASQVLRKLIADYVDAAGDLRAYRARARDRP